MSHRIKLTLEEVVEEDGKYPNYTMLDEITIRVPIDPAYTFQQAARILVAAIAEGPQPGEPSEEAR